MGSRARQYATLSKAKTVQLAKQSVKRYPHDQGGVFLALSFTMNVLEREQIIRAKGEKAYELLERIPHLPKKIGHNYKPVMEMNLEIDLERMKFHPRMKVFFSKGLACTGKNCKCIGTRMVLGMSEDGKGHVDIYTENWILMTVDHFIPKSKGGDDRIENLFPMCTNCNLKKGDKMPITLVS